MFLPLPSSAWCSLRCFTMLHNIMTMASWYRTYDGVFNLRQLTANTQVNVVTLRELFFADDCALNSNSEAKIQQCVNHFSRYLVTYFVLASAPIRQNSCTSLYHEICTTGFVNDEPLTATDSITYMGSTLSREANIYVQVSNRLSKANSAFGRLRKKLWERR